MISIPTILVPVVSTAPIPPMDNEVTIVYPKISWRHTENIIRWHSRYSQGNNRWANIGPRSVIDSRPEPIASIVEVPRAPEKIKTIMPRHQIDIASLTGNYHYIRGAWKHEWRRWRNLSSTDNRHAQNQKQRNHKYYALLHKMVPPFREIRMLRSHMRPKD
jgi:hypothetical protein